MEWLAKLFDLLNARGWQTAMIAVAAGVFLYLSKAEILPPLESEMVIAAWVVLLVCGALAAASLGTVIQRAVGAGWRWWQQKRAIERVEQAFRDYIPHLSAKERQILGYLREKNQKTFIADHDGGYAGTLVAQGFVRYIGVRGQTYDIDKCPMAVPDYVWKVMQERPQDFPYEPEYRGTGRDRTEVHPWRIPWGAR